MTDSNGVGGYTWGDLCHSWKSTIRSLCNSRHVCTDGPCPCDTSTGSGCHSPCAARRSDVPTSEGDEVPLPAPDDASVSSGPRTPLPPDRWVHDLVSWPRPFSPNTATPLERPAAGAGTIRPSPREIEAVVTHEPVGAGMSITQTVVLNYKYDSK